MLKKYAGAICALASLMTLLSSNLSTANSACQGPSALPSGTLESCSIEKIGDKKGLIKKTFRAPNYETPIEYFDQAFTPNERFFIRYHLATIPEVDPKEWKLTIGGEADHPVTFTLKQLKKDFPQVELAAVSMCAGNRRGLFDPHVPGVEWGYGAMGNAKWKGVRLKDVLEKAGVKKDVIEIAFNGADSGASATTPDFVKSLPVAKALDPNTLIAFEMNGKPLPHYNGAPARLIVPGWAATYWTKHLTDITLLTKPLETFWMKPAYRIPRGKFAAKESFTTQQTADTTPITELVVNSLITSVREGMHLKKNHPVEVRGVAWDGGYGIKTVEVSLDGGTTWETSKLGKDYGNYSWRQFKYAFTPKNAGKMSIMAKATNNSGNTQVFKLIFNPAGYHNNVVQTVNVVVD